MQNSVSLRTAIFLDDAPLSTSPHIMITSCAENSSGLVACSDHPRQDFNDLCMGSSGNGVIVALAADEKRQKNTATFALCMSDAG